jgi:hypothetical protein
MTDVMAVEQPVAEVKPLGSSTITEAEVGQVIATNGVLEEIVMVTSPTGYGYDYFCLSDDDHVIYNLHVATSHFGAGSVLLANGKIPFTNLILKSIPVGCSFDITTAAPPAPPALTSLVPDTVVSGDPDLTLSCMGTGFTDQTIIRFGGQDEPTTLVSDTEVTTIVKPSLFAPAIVQVQVRDGDLFSEILDFTFTEPVVP